MRGRRRQVWVIVVFFFVADCLDSDEIDEAYRSKMF